MARKKTVARILGLKLMLLAASFGALAALVQSPEASLAETTWGGMKLLHLILGTAGAGASLFFLPQFTGRMLGATVSCGIICATVGTPLLWMALNAMTMKVLGAAAPATAENAVAVGLGVAGVYIIPGVQRLARTFSSNPLGFMAWLRGGPPPSPPPDGGEEGRRP